MPEIKIRGHDYQINLTRDSFNRRSIQYGNKIVEKFKLIGLTVDDIEIKQERLAIKRAPAKVSWWIDDHHCHFSFNKMSKFVDNLLVVFKVIDFNVDELVAGNISLEEFIGSFRESDGFDEKRTKAREFFGLEEDHIDLEMVNKKYRSLSKTLHPDMPTGDVIKFKELNEHHKTLKRELE